MTNEAWTADGERLYLGAPPAAIEHHNEQRQRLDAAHMRIGELTAYLMDLLVWTGALLGTAPGDAPDPSASILVLASRRAAQHGLAAAELNTESMAAHVEQLVAGAAALRAACIHARRALDLVHDEDRLREHLDAALADDAGSALLSELAAARAVVRMVVGVVDESGRCVVCGATVYEAGDDFPHADDCALVVYDAATKGARPA